MAPTPTQLGITIRQVREAQELSIEALAAKAGVSWRYLSRIERSEKPANPTWTVIGGIAEALGLEISELAKRAEDLSVAESS